MRDMSSLMRRERKENPRMAWKCSRNLTQNARHIQWFGLFPLAGSWLRSFVAVYDEILITTSSGPMSNWVNVFHLTEIWQNSNYPIRWCHDRCRWPKSQLTRKDLGLLICKFRFHLFISRSISCLRAKQMVGGMKKPARVKNYSTISRSPPLTFKSHDAKHSAQGSESSISDYLNKRIDIKFQISSRRQGKETRRRRKAGRAEKEKNFCSNGSNNPFMPLSGEPWLLPCNCE